MRTVSLAVLIAASLSTAAAVGASWEKPKTFKASEVLTAAEKKGEHHEVDDKVPGANDDLV